MALWKNKIRAATVHLGISLSIAALAAALVFGLWYPYPYRVISGGRELFWLVTVVDVVLGPLMTFVVFNPTKSSREKLLDFSIIGLLQLGALCYGLWSVAYARPVHLIFAVDRFEVVHAADVPAKELSRAPAEFQRLPWTGPTILGWSRAEGSQTLDVTMAELSGLRAVARPFLWRSYDTARGDVRKASRPVSELVRRFPDQTANIERVLKKVDQPVDQLAYLPMTGRKDQFWTVIIGRQSAEVLAFLPLDSF